MLKYMSIGGFFIGLFLIGLGFFMIRFNQQVSHTLGTPAFLTKTFGPGREYAFYAMLSFIVIIIGFMVMFGLFGVISDLIFGPFRGLIKE